MGFGRMTWTKLSDDFSDDCWELSDAAVRLHMEGLVWSNRKLLDLRLVKADMIRWAKRPAAADELVAAGWWKDADDHYVIVHHAIYQRDREAVLKQQEANQKNGQKGGRPKGPPRERAPRKRSPKTDSITESESESVSDDDSSVVPETHSLSESPTERDGTGRAWSTREPPKSDSVSVNGDWPDWRGQGSDPFEEYR
jgi:hypothetical protein